MGLQAWAAREPSAPISHTQGGNRLLLQGSTWLQPHEGRTQSTICISMLAGAGRTQEGLWLDKGFQLQRSASSQEEEAWRLAKSACEKQQGLCSNASAGQIYLQTCSPGQGAVPLPFLQFAGSACLQQPTLPFMTCICSALAALTLRALSLLAMRLRIFLRSCTRGYRPQTGL